MGFGEQPGPAREPSIACRPNGQLSPCLGMGDFDDGVQIHRYASAFKEMHLRLRILASPAQTLAWVGLVFELQRWLVYLFCSPAFLGQVTVFPPTRLYLSHIHA